MEIVTKIAPIVLALIMLGLGLGLSTKDFTRILNTLKIFCWIIFTVNNFTINRFYNCYNIGTSFTNSGRFNDYCSRTEALHQIY